MIVQSSFRRYPRVVDAALERVAGARVWWEQTRDYPGLRRRFRKHMGYDLNLSEPRTFNEKMQWRKVRDRRPILATFADKFAVQEYVENKVGTQKADEILNRPILVTEDPDAVDFSTLPEQYVVKANHASGWNVLVTRDSPANELLLRKHMERWLRRSYGKSKLEWAYQRVPRKIMIEPFVDAGELPLPDDIQFFMFGGGCLVVLWRREQFGEKRFCFLRPSGDIWDLQTRRKNFLPDDLPSFYDDMLGVANCVAEGMDHVRVDFMVAGGRYYLNELTIYPRGGFNDLWSVDFYRELGDAWLLPEVSEVDHESCAV